MAVQSANTPAAAHATKLHACYPCCFLPSCVHGRSLTPPAAAAPTAAFPAAFPAGTFLRGVLDKVGVEPQVQRIGAYKSAGDQLLRRDMSEAQREQLGELLDDIYESFLDTVAEARGKTREVGAVGGGWHCRGPAVWWVFAREGPPARLGLVCVCRLACGGLTGAGGA